MLRWLLIIGYVFAISLYTYILGAYLGRVLGFEKNMYHYFGGTIAVLLTLLNLAGMHENAAIKDFFVYSRIATILFIIVIGFFSMEKQELLPVFEYSTFNLIDAAALIFISYEGFQLLTYNYKDIADYHNNFPRGMAISIPTVILIYMLVALVTAGSLSNRKIASNTETVLVDVARTVLGPLWFKFAVAAIAVTIGSSLFTTIYTTAGLAKRTLNNFPILIRWKSGGIPVVFTVLALSCAIIIQIFLTLHQIIVLSSLIFLLIFAVVNLSAYIHLNTVHGSRFFPLSELSVVCRQQLC